MDHQDTKKTWLYSSQPCIVILTKCYSNVDQSYPPNVQVLLKENVEHRIWKDFNLHQRSKESKISEYISEKYIAADNTKI